MQNILNNLINVLLSLASPDSIWIFPLAIDSNYAGTKFNVWNHKDQNYMQVYDIVKIAYLYFYKMQIMVVPTS